MESSAQATTNQAGYAGWLRQGLRSALFMKPDWRGLVPTPGLVAALVLTALLAWITADRLMTEGPASFDWISLLDDWFGIAVAAWVAWALMPRAAGAPTQGHPACGSAAALFAMLVAQFVFIVIGVGAILIPIYREGLVDFDALPDKLEWIFWLALLGWLALAQCVLVWRSTAAPFMRRTGACALLMCAIAAHFFIAPPHHWYVDDTQADAAQDASAQNEDQQPAPLQLTQEETEWQPRLLQTQLQALQPHEPGHVHFYAITFAPYADDDVFARESQLVASVMQTRFHAEGRTIQLVNHPDTIMALPWATPLNLQRTIQRMGQLMDRDKDVLFIHITSHGALDGELAMSFDPLALDPVTPQQIKQWLDDAGIRYRVISISACYSGSWIEPLAGNDTLVMTAADANHTSYGCGSGSELTFFGRAMYDEQLRRTRSFEAAHAAARKVIADREREAGKTDGYSNPQIHVGEGIRKRLAAVEASWQP